MADGRVEVGVFSLHVADKGADDEVEVLVRKVGVEQAHEASAVGIGTKEHGFFGGASNFKERYGCGKELD